MEKIAKMQWLESKCLLFNNLTLLLISTLRIILVSSYTIHVKMSTGNRNYHRQVAKVSSVAYPLPRLSKSDILEIIFIYNYHYMFMYNLQPSNIFLQWDGLNPKFNFVPKHRYTSVPKHLSTVIYFSIRAK